MTYDELHKKTQELQQYEREQTKKKESTQNTLKSLNSDAADTKQKAAHVLAGAARDNTGTATSTINQSRRLYDDKQQKIKNEADNKETGLSELEKNISEIDHILNELKKIEPSLREAEQKSKSLVEQADKLIRAR